MTSTPTKRLRADKQFTGDNKDTWGIRINNDLDLVDEAFGVASLTINGNYTLTANNFTSDEGRRLVLQLSGTGMEGSGPAMITIPAVDKPYFVDNGCASDVIVGFPGGDTVVIRAGTAFWLYSDGVNVAKTTDLPLDEIAPPDGPVTMAGQRLTNLAPGVDPNDAATVGQTSAAGAAAAALSAQQAAASAAAAATFIPSNYVSQAEAFYGFVWGRF